MQLPVSLFGYALHRGKVDAEQKPSNISKQKRRENYDAGSDYVVATGSPVLSRW